LVFWESPEELAKAYKMAVASLSTIKANTNKIN
jgi:hypothetical protein